MTDGAGVLVHATSVMLGVATAPFGGALDAAVLLLGQSGAGKSDVALRLIAAGAKLIADDQTLLFADGARLFAGPAPSLRGQMEVRGVGILRLAAAAPSPVILAVRLEPAEPIPRLPEPASYVLPPALQACPAPPLIALNPFEASTPAKIAATASAIARGAFVAGADSPPSGSFL